MATILAKSAINLVLLFIGVSSLFAEAPYSFFVPPKDWEVADPQKLSPRVKFCFLKKLSSGFCPSINLATEEINVSFENYMKAVKKIHEQNPLNRWREVGKIRTNSGDAALIEIDTKNNWGEVRLIQMILVKGKTAYIMTAAGLKKEIPKYYSDFEKSFKSFTLTDDLFLCVSSPRKEALKQKYDQLQNTFTKSLAENNSPEQLFSNEKFQKEHWTPFQNSVINDFSDLGAPWQVLLLQSAQIAFGLDRIGGKDYKSTQQN